MVRKDYDKVIDRTDPKWGHPEARDMWLPGGDVVNPLLDPTTPREEQDALYSMMCSGSDDFKKSMLEEDPELRDAGVTAEFVVPGCPEEPETSVRVVVRTPSSAKPGDRLPAIFYVCGGALAICAPSSFPLEELSRDLEAVVVCPVYRVAFQAPYPAAVNDLHAAYKWMTEHAKELCIDTDRVVITGTSSGGHLATALPFRLARYGYSPRGCVATEPVVEDRSWLPSHKVSFGGKNWDGEQVHQCLSYWLGRELYASPNLGPEALANRASVDECNLVCPYVIITAEHDPDRDGCIEFVRKLHAAGTFGEIHIWGGVGHAHLFNAQDDYGRRYHDVYFGAIADFLEYDIRRTWRND